MKPKILFISIITLLSISSKAQLKWGLYGGGSITMYENFTPDFTTGALGTMIFKSNFTNAMSANMGIYVEYGLLKNLYAETGIYKGKRGYEQEHLVITEEYGAIDSYGNPSLEAQDVSSYSYTYEMPYIGIPIVFNYYVINRGFKFYLTFGQKIGWCSDSETTNQPMGGHSSGTISQTNIPSDGESYENYDIIVGEGGDFKPFNYDLVFGGGVGLGRFYLVYNFDYGILNNSQIDEIIFKSRVQNISLKLELTKKKK